MRGPDDLLPRLGRRLGILLLAWLGGCGGGGGSSASPDEPPATGLVVGSVPGAWALTDINPASPSYQQAVGPALSAGHASVWYFGHAT